MGVLVRSPRFLDSLMMAGSAELYREYRAGWIANKGLSGDDDDDNAFNTAGFTGLALC